MGRRHFLRKMLGILKTMAIVSLFPKNTLLNAADDSHALRPHYKPLNGRSLREIAREKQHHGSNRFLNPLSPERQAKFWKVMSWKLFHENRFEEYLADEPVVSLKMNWEPIRHHRGLSLTFLKHACVVIKDFDRLLVVDPIFSDLFWFIKDFTPLELDLGTMPPPDHVLITHGHYDHLDVQSLKTLNPATHIITPLGYNAIFQDINRKNRTPLDWFETFYDGSREIILLPCNHWTMRNPISGPNRSLWGSYLIKTAGGYTIFISGDTAYFDGFEQLGKEFSIDLAVMNVGAYEPRWFMAPSHMNPREAVQAFKDLHAKKLMIVHWGTFRLGDEPVHFPPLHIKQELKKQGLINRLIDLQHGQTLFL